MKMNRLYNFNRIRRSPFHFSPILVVDKSMSAWLPKTTARGGLPNTSYIACESELIGTEFKMRFISIKVQREKDSISEEKYVKETKKNNTACTIRLVEKSKIHYILYKFFAKI